MVSLSQAFKPRKQYLIDRNFQVRFALELMVLVLLVPFIVWANFYVLGQYAMTMEGGPDAISSWGMTGALLRHQWPLLLLVYIFNFGLVYLFIVYYSHRVAGPVYKFARTLEGVCQGKLNEEINLRKHDYFHDVADRVNEVISGFRDCVVDARDRLETIANVAGEQQDKNLQAAINDLRTILNRYETSAIVPATGQDTEIQKPDSSTEDKTAPAQ